MNRPDTDNRDLIAAIILIYLAAWLGFPWEAFAVQFPVMP